MAATHGKGGFSVVKKNSRDIDLTRRAPCRAEIARMTPVARARVAELKRAHAEGRAADIGDLNPYRGQIVLAAVWRGGYRRMLDDMRANAPARQAFLRRAAGRQSH